MKKEYSWKRFSKIGYEVSSSGDRRFSAMSAKMPDGRTIEMHYQCDIKGYDSKGYNWRLGKGKPPLNTSVNLWEEYLKLWKIWAFYNEMLIKELSFLASEKDFILTDRFATTEVNQAHALSIILNELGEKNESNS